MMIAEGARPKVSALVSTYNAERFMRGALEDLIGQTLFAQGRLEIVVVNSGSQQGEEAIVREFQARYPNITYLRSERETIYGAWNRGIRAARGEYLTSANTDDRHRPDALEVMARALDERDVGLVYADSLITRRPNETFAANSADRVFRWPDYSLRQLLVTSLFGPQPMWRRSLHDEIGGFDASYRVAGDYEFFIRAAWRRGAWHLSEILGLYLEGGFESNNLERCTLETRQALGRYRAIIPIEDIYPALRGAAEPHSARAVALLDFAGCLAGGPHPDPAQSQRCRDLALVALARAPLRSWLDPSLWGFGVGCLLGRAGRAAPWSAHPLLRDLPPLARQIIFERG
jgi:glycosyltransferase involved in cell wall biosynthesis